MSGVTGEPLENQRQEDFCQHLAAGKPKAEAYRLAGYKPNDGGASRLAGNVKIKARLAEIRRPILDKYAVTNDRIVGELAMLAFSRTKDYRAILMSGDLNDVSSEDSAAIREITVERRVIGRGKGKKAKEGDDARLEFISTKLRLADKHQPLATLARIQGMMKDGPDVNIPVSFTVEFAAPRKAG